jgi:uncharacterized protein YndB with AHSA1/START domain
VADELRIEDGAHALHVEREYDAPPQQVWSAWTDPARLARWLAVPDGPLSDRPIRLDFGGGTDEWADVSILQAEEPRLLVLRWSFVGVETSELRVEITAADHGGARVTLDHRGLGDSTVGYGAGWQAYLVSLEEELGGPGDGLTWAARFAGLLPEWQARAAG